MELRTLPCVISERLAEGVQLTVCKPHFCSSSPLPHSIANIQIAVNGSSVHLDGGSQLVPPALVTASFPVGDSVVYAINAVLLPPGTEAVPLPSPPPPPPKRSPPRKGVGAVGGFNANQYYYLGCFNNSMSQLGVYPLINGQSTTTSSSVTISSCALAAATYTTGGVSLKYWALVNGNKCVGFTTFIGATALGAVPEASCNVACTGAPNKVSCASDACTRAQLLQGMHSPACPPARPPVCLPACRHCWALELSSRHYYPQMCGGSKISSLYTFIVPVAVEPVCTLASCYNPLGCFVDPGCYTGGKWGLETYLSPAQGALTIGGCSDAALARGYRYFYVENGNVCRAGTTIAYAVSYGPYGLSTSYPYTGDCSVQCEGDPSTTCGGACASQLYQASAEGGNSLPVAAVLRGILVGLHHLAGLALPTVAGSAGGCPGFQNNSAPTGCDCCSTGCELLEQHVPQLLVLPQKNIFEYRL